MDILMELKKSRKWQNHVIQYTNTHTICNIEIHIKKDKHVICFKKM